MRSLPLCPEIQLALIADVLDLDAPARDVAVDGRAPYFGFCWASGQALARFILDRPHLVRGSRVLDFGSGSGVVAIAAALAGASEVVACDSDPDARVAIRRNASENGVRLTIAARPRHGFDVLLAADVCYDERNRDLLRELAQAGVLGLVSDPGRWALPSECLEPLASFEVETIPTLTDDPCEVRIFRLAQSSARPTRPGSDRPIVWRSPAVRRSGSSAASKSGSSG